MRVAQYAGCRPNTDANFGAFDLELLNVHVHEACRARLHSEAVEGALKPWISFAGSTTTLESKF